MSGGATPVAPTTWGLVATIRAPALQILRFAAYHLEQGAHRLYLYLDDDNPQAYNPLKDHPKIRVQTCDAAHWKRLGHHRPDRHQVRQSRNATHAHTRRTEVDWLIHMDVDEFLVPRQSLADSLAALGPDQTSARVRPMELLGGSATAFKGFIPPNKARQALVRAIYPQFGKHIRGGFLSHLAGKLFVRTGLPGLTVQIHNAFQGDVMLPDAVELTQVDLAHCHATSWQAWRGAYDYRLEKGSYRAELKPAAAKGGLSLHDLFHQIEAEAGQAGLRRFYDEVIGDSPDLRARLDAHGLLRLVDLDLDTVTQKHFPGAVI
jgi:hypothetical protein